MNVPSSPIDELGKIAEPAAIIPQQDYPQFLTEWRGRWQGSTPLILAPSTVEELSRIMSYAYAHDIAIVPQGGNTGLVGGQIPKGEVLISLKRMRRIRQVSATDFTMTVEAGLTLAEAQDAAAKAERLFPLSIGSEGTCQIGGILSTNAGGVNVLKYGNARDLALGLEAVLPDGRIWHGLNRLRKNNVGYDLKHLLIGGEGTLGIITAATLKLVPRPAETLTLFVGVNSAEHAVELLSHVQSTSAGAASSFELMSSATLELVLSAFPDLPRPLAGQYPYYCLIELGAGRMGVLDELSADILDQAIQKDLLANGTIAQNQAQTEKLWALRHNASAAMKSDPSYCVKCDISVPIRNIPDFLIIAEKAVCAATPGARIIAFGHLGDGNIHFDILGPTDGDDTSWRHRAAETERLVHDVCVAHEGSISAEHGIGQLKREELAERKDPTELSVLRGIKQLFDPKGLMNPGKLL